jgi:hypothetical protein
MEFEKGEQVEWIVADKAHLILSRQQVLARSGECKKNDSLLEGFDSLLAQASRVIASADTANRLRAHLLAQLECLGRHTVTGLLATNGQLHSDWTADYRLCSRQRFDAAELFAPIRRGAQQSLAPQEALTVARDDSILRKTGRKIPGSVFAATL